jgi:hypothetical protein
MQCSVLNSLDQLSGVFIAVLKNEFVSMEHQGIALKKIVESVGFFVLFAWFPNALAIHKRTTDDARISELE